VSGKEWPCRTQVHGSRRFVGAEGGGERGLFLVAWAREAGRSAASAPGRRERCAARRVSDSLGERRRALGGEGSRCPGLHARGRGVPTVASGRRGGGTSHFRSRLRARFGQSLVALGPPLDGPRFHAMGPFADPMPGDRLQLLNRPTAQEGGLGDARRPPEQKISRQVPAVVLATKSGVLGRRTRRPNTRAQAGHFRRWPPAANEFRSQRRPAPRRVRPPKRSR